MSYVAAAAVIVQIQIGHLSTLVCFSASTVLAFIDDSVSIYLGCALSDLIPGQMKWWRYIQ